MDAVKKRIVSLPDRLNRGLKRAATGFGRSDAEFTREGVVERELTPRPRIPLFNSGDPTLAERVDELPAGGFGEA
jgi:hypothetical protein